MIPIRRMFACAAVALVATACFGAAATLGLVSDNVAAGSADTTIDCHTGATVTYLYDGTKVSSVDVTLPTACQGGRVWLALLDSTNALTAQVGPLHASAATTNFDVPDVEATLVTQYRIAVIK